MTPQDSKIFRPWDKSDRNDAVSSLYNAAWTLILEPSSRRLTQTSPSVTSSSDVTTPSNATITSSTTSSSTESNVSLSHFISKSNVTRDVESASHLTSPSNSNAAATAAAHLHHHHIQHSFNSRSSPVIDPILSAFPSVASATSFNAAVAAVTAAAASGHSSVGSLASLIASNASSSSSPGNMKKQRPKRFHCPHCQIAFSNQGQLRGHVRIHTGERPFVCDHDGCGKSFTRNEELTRHKR